MTGNSSRLDPTPKKKLRAEVSGRILADCHFLVDPTPKRIYSAEVRCSKRRHANCSPPTTTTTPTTTTYTVLGPDGFAAGKKGKGGGIWALFEPIPRIRRGRASCTIGIHAGSEGNEAGDSTNTFSRIDKVRVKIWMSVDSFSKKAKVSGKERVSCLQGPFWHHKNFS